MAVHPRVVCSSITFRRLPLAEALGTIRSLGFGEIDLGALPGVCDHVPYELTDDAVREVATTIRESGLGVRSINADVGDLNEDVDAAGAAARDAHLDQLFDLAEQVEAPAIVLPCGSQGHETISDLGTDLDRVAGFLRHAASLAAARGLEVWVESQHSGRLCYDMDRAGQLTERLEGSGVRVVLDLSHVVASGDEPVEWIHRFADEIAHVHIRDARPGNIHVTPGNGDVDFAAALSRLGTAGYDGAFSLELETDDVSNEDRPDAALRAGELISSLL
ncbi:sugar phosphate isomerase/epimerase family protein [Georgenia sp. SUBG003]|uniref:sugar phosphate isomerase/epimerase family protein n=1 Tax=Georgenia sp. SUBG003 TaxID=1497974 RepID=UPI0004D66193|nr:xylose isomerase [Georgenia sp. SUBG003]